MRENFDFMVFEHLMVICARKADMSFSDDCHVLGL